jgi:hypothetical protein
MVLVCIVLPRVAIATCFAVVEVPFFPMVVMVSDILDVGAYILYPLLLKKTLYIDKVSFATRVKFVL